MEQRAEDRDFRHMGKGMGQRAESIEVLDLGLRPKVKWKRRMLNVTVKKLRNTDLSH